MQRGGMQPSPSCLLFVPLSVTNLVGTHSRSRQVWESEIWDKIL